ncbi:cysteine desulfurase [Desulfonatronum thiosulfatophilum]|uniref:Cysteine desulfurase n=1 Tax=Desulfonatronum thiosulfatophilum TaxID=617002 RepID=A0A1G6CSN1_9BACT|nr:cysteine desulfurase NifS [Desulfonatronum thiosulfatophilum]SDB35886.1 cysteine desulfurase [Desulfonatronum thiosulfatophilum]
MKEVYLDNNATTMVAPEVLEAMLPYLRSDYGNASSMHGFGGKVGKVIRQAREQTAQALGCSAEEIIFTSCGTESDNTAIFSAVRSQPEKRHVVTTRVEHPAVLNVASHLEIAGYEVTSLKVDEQGRLDLQELEDSLRPDTALVSVMHANNESGVVFPLERIAEIVKSRDILLHTDAVQTVGKLPIDLQTLAVDFLALSAHKVHGPKGVGALFVRRGVPFRPFMLGGHQEKGRRAGTENVAGIVALGKAMEMAEAGIVDENTRVKALRDRLENAIMESIPDVRRNGDPENRLPNTSSLAFKYIEGESILLMLDQYGICASSGSACTSGSLEPSHVLRAMGVPFTYAHGSIRFSLSRYTTDQEIDLVLRELPGIVSRLRAMSPFTGDQAGQACAC